MTEKVARDFIRVRAKDRFRCQRFMVFYSNDGSENLIETQFCVEDRLKTGGRRSRRVQIYAFKAGQLRVYGGLVPRRRWFVCTEIDRAKKRRLADQDKLSRAARNLGKFL